MQFNCVKKLHEKNELNVLWHSTGFPIRFVSFLLVSSTFILARVSMADKKKGCRLLFASHISHNVIQKDEKKA